MSYIFRSLSVLALSALIVNAPCHARSVLKTEKNVKDFGAVGDGKTDDTAAIQAAIQANAANFPPGRYLYTSALAARGILFGDNATLVSGTSDAYLYSTGDHLLCQALAFDTAPGVKVKTMISAIRVDAPTAVSINYCSFLGNADIGVSLNYTIGTVGECMFSNAGTAITAANSVGLSINGNDLTSSTNSTNFAMSFTNNQLTKVVSNRLRSAGISLTGESGTIVQKNDVKDATIGIQTSGCQSCQVSQNSISNCGQAMNLSGSSNQSVTQNVIDGSKTFAISAVSPSGTLSIDSNTISNSGSWAIATVNGVNVSVTRNQISNAGLSTPIRAVIDSTSASSSDTITSNTYSGNQKHVDYFIFTSPGPPIAKVSGNKTTTTLPSDVGGN